MSRCLRASVYQRYICDTFLSMEASASDISATASAERLRLRAEARQRRLLAAEAARRMHVVTGTPVQWKTPTSSTDLREGVRDTTVVLEQNSLNVLDSSGGPQNSGNVGPSVADPDGRELPGGKRDNRCQWGLPSDKTISAVNSRELFSQCKQAEMNRGPTELIGVSESSTGKTVRARVNQVAVAEAPSDSPAGNKREITNLVSSMPVYAAHATTAAAVGQSSCSGGFTSSSVSQVVGTSVEGSFPHAQQHDRLSGSLKKQDTRNGLSRTEQRKHSVLWFVPFILFSALASRCVKCLVRWQNHLQRLRWLQLVLNLVIATAWASFPPPSSSVGPSSLSSVSQQSGRDKTEAAAWTSEVLPSRRSFRSTLPEKLQEWVQFVVWQPLLWVVVSSVVLLIAEHSRELDTWLERRRQGQDKQGRQGHGRKSMQWEEGEDGEGNSDELLGRAMVWLSRVLLVMKLGSALLEVLRQVAVFVAMYCCMRYGLTWFATVLECPSGVNSSFHDRP